MWVLPTDAAAPGWPSQEEKDEKLAVTHGGDEFPVPDGDSPDTPLCG
jgi:hypothetical protein